MHGKLTGVETPLVSVIIPCRGEARSIGRCLGSLIAGDYPKDRLEVLVVDGESEDGTRDVVGKLARRYPFIHLVSNPARITPAALNKGVRAAKGDVIVIASAHAGYSSDFVSKSVASLLASEADCVGGPVSAFPSSPGRIPEAIALALSCQFGVGISRFRISSSAGFVDTVAYGCYRRDVFERIGLFDERLVRNQDIEFNFRLRDTGGKVYLSPEIKSYYYCRGDIAGFCEQAFANGRWNAYTVALTRRPLSWRHFAPMFFVVGLLGTGVLSFLSTLFLWILGILLCAHLTCAVAAAMKCTGRATARAILPVVFLALHLSYGLGILWGLVTLMNVRPNGH